MVQETLSVLTRKLKPAFSPEQALRTLDQVLTPLWRVMPSAALYRHAIRVQERYGFAF